jgi:hypothetical protein
MVQKGKFSAGMLHLVSVLYKVLLPTFGRPTMPTWNPQITANRKKIFIRSKCSRETQDSTRRLEKSVWYETSGAMFSDREKSNICVGMTPNTVMMFFTNLQPSGKLSECPWPKPLLLNCSFLRHSSWRFFLADRVTAAGRLKMAVEDAQFDHRNSESDGGRTS